MKKIILFLVFSIFVSVGVNAKINVQTKYENVAKQENVTQNGKLFNTKYTGELCYQFYSGNYCCPDGSEALGYVTVAVFFCDFPEYTLAIGDLINNDFEEACGP